MGVPANGVIYGRSRGAAPTVQLTHTLHRGRLTSMLPPHPFRQLTIRQMAQLLFLFLLSTLIFSVLFFRWDHQLQHAGAPYGIVSFELAWSVPGITRVIGPWTEAARALALRITLYDYVYLLCYSTTLALLCFLIGHWRMRSHDGNIGRFWFSLAWWPWIAAACDAIENCASLPLLLSKPQVPWPQIMTIAAMIKFSILAVTVTLIILSPLALLWPKRRPA